jgi:signal transduction histidine kinase
VDQTLEIDGFDSKLFQLWSNILKNAIEAMEEREEYGLIKIYSSVNQSSVTITIENNGPKIPDNIQKQIFTKFFTTKAEQNGTGLGLNIVQNIIEDHNAQIKLTSDDDWTRFSITFAL